MTDKVQKIRAEIERRMRVMKENFATDEASKIKHALTLRLIDHQELLAFIDSMQEEPVSEDLGDYINELSKQFQEVSFAKLSRIAVRVAKWQKEQFEMNRLAACDRQTEEEAEREQDFVMGIIECEHRQPTFDDAIKYGMRLQRENMMNGATDVTVHVEAGNYPYIPQIELYDYDKDIPLAKEGDKYKVVFIKEG